MVPDRILDCLPDEEIQAGFAEFTVPIEAEEMAEFVSGALGAGWMKRDWHRFLTAVTELRPDMLFVRVRPTSDADRGEFFDCNPSYAVSIDVVGATDDQTSTLSCLRHLTNKLKSDLYFATLGKPFLAVSVKSDFVDAEAFERKMEGYQAFKQRLGLPEVTCAIARVLGDRL